jgi:uncharacterized membrane protein YozB (DUF420 family)
MDFLRPEVRKQGIGPMAFALFCAFNLPRLNLHIQIALILLLSTGVLLARTRRFRLHAVMQCAVVLLNLGLILGIMLPSLRQQMPAALSPSWSVSIAIVLLHSFVGALAWLMAFYVVLVSGTPLIPRKLRFLNYRRWMRAAFAMWWAAFLLGCAVYYLLYMDP